MTSSLMQSACRVSLAPAREGFRCIASCLPRTGSPIILQFCHHKTCQHSSEQRKLTRTLTLWRLHLDDTSAPPTCLSLRVCSAPRSMPSHHTYVLTLKITHTTHCASWLTRTTDWTTSHTPLQTCDNWLTAHWGLAAGKEHMLYLPNSRGLYSTLWMWYRQLVSLFEWIKTFIAAKWS